MRFRINRLRTALAHPSPGHPAPTPVVHIVELEVVEAPLSAHEQDVIRASISVIEPFTAEMTV